MGDILILGYCYLKFSDKERIHAIIEQALRDQGLKMNSIPSQDILAIYLMTIDVLKALIIFILILHTIVYIFHSRNKKFAFNYVRILVWSASFCCIIGGVLFLGDNFLTGLAFILQGLLYSYVLIGLFHFPLLPAAKK